MAHDFVGTQIRRSSRQLILFGLVICLIPSLVFWFTRRMAYNGIAGPFPVDERTLLELTNPEERWNYFVKYRSEVPPVDTDMREGTKDAMKRKIVLVHVGDRLLLTILPINHSGVVYQGRLQTIKNPADVDRVKQLKARIPDMDKLLLPYQLDGDFNMRGEVFALFATMGGLLLGGLWPIGLVCYRLSGPARQPILRKLAKIGDVNQVRASIDAEVAGGPSVRIAGLLVTPLWLISHTYFSIDVARMEDVVWYYKLVIRGQGASIQAIIRTRTGDKFGVEGNEKEVFAVMHLLSTQVPWALGGYETGLEALWNTDQAKFIHNVDEARQRYLANPQAFRKT